MPAEEVTNVRALKLVLNKQHGFPPRFRQRLFLRGDPLEDAFELATSTDMVLEFVVLDFVSVSLQQVEKFIRAATFAKLSKVGCSHKNVLSPTVPCSYSLVFRLENLAR